MADFRKAFPDFPETDMPEIPAGFVDLSWKQEACPVFWNARLGMAIWVDYVDPVKSEIFDPHGDRPDPVNYKRFSLWITSSDGDLMGDEPLCETNEWTEILSAISARIAELYA